MGSRCSHRWRSCRCSPAQSAAPHPCTACCAAGLSGRATRPEAETETSAFYERMVDELPAEGKALFEPFLNIDRGHRTLVQDELDALPRLGSLTAASVVARLLAGGAVVNSLFARRGLIDEVVVTVSPLIFGRGISLFPEGIGVELDFVSVEPVDDQVVCLTYRVLEVVDQGESPAA